MNSWIESIPEPSWRLSVTLPEESGAYASNFALEPPAARFGPGLPSWPRHLAVVQVGRGSAREFD